MSTQPPIEDISAIVNRFQAWAATRDPDGVRELTYDEAIRSRRFRARVDEPLSEAAESVPVPEAEAASSKKKKPARPKKSAAASHRKKIARHADRRGSSAVTPVAVSQPPDFRQVLAEKISILPVSSSQAAALVQRRSMALSLRVSAAEHALLKRRAAKANLPVSCYLRNCALEVEELRARVNALLTAGEAVPRFSSRSGIFGGISRFLCSIFGGNKSTLKLQA